MKYIFPVKSYIAIAQPYHIGTVTTDRTYTGTHYGIDFGWNSNYGGAYQPIYAAEDGTVTAAVDGYGNTYPKSRIYGNYVMIKHGDGYTTVYGHMNKGSVCVKKGAKITKGTQIGCMGNSGYSMGNHLHFEIRKGSTQSSAVDPLPYLAYEDTSCKVCEADKAYYTFNYRNPKDDEQTSKQVKCTHGASSYSANLTGTYKVNASKGLYIRDGAGTNYTALACLPNGTEFHNYGYYSDVNGTRWLYGIANVGNVSYYGHCCATYLTR